MLQAGDELGHTKLGNNNSYCQDSPVSWTSWQLDRPKRDFLEFVRLAIKLRKEHAAFRRRTFFRGSAMRERDMPDVLWLRPDALQMSGVDWSNPYARCIGRLLIGDAIDETDERANPIRDQSFLVILNAFWEALPFKLPAVGAQRGAWELTLDTRAATGRREQPRLAPGEALEVAARSLAVLGFVPEGRGEG